MTLHDIILGAVMLACIGHLFEAIYFEAAREWRKRKIRMEERS